MGMGFAIVLVYEVSCSQSNGDISSDRE